MKHIITAVGNRELNDILRKQDIIKIEGPDIQYQEGIIETLEKYQEIDMIILSDEIIGKLSLEELIINIIMVKKNVEIVLITNDYLDLKMNKNIIKVINKYNYVNTIIKYLITENYINKGFVNLDRKEIINPIDNVISYETKQDIIKTKAGKEENVVTIIGEAGSRKNNFYFNIISNNPTQKNTNHRF